MDCKAPERPTICFRSRDCIMHARNQLLGLEKGEANDHIAGSARQCTVFRRALEVECKKTTGSVDRASTTDGPSDIRTEVMPLNRTECNPRADKGPRRSIAVERRGYDGPIRAAIPKYYYV